MYFRQCFLAILYKAFEGLSCQKCLKLLNKHLLLMPEWPTPLLARVNSSMLLQISYGEHHCDDHIVFANRLLQFVLPDKGVYGLFVELVQGPTLFSYMSPKQQE